MEGYSIKIEKKDSETNKLYNILIYDHSSKNSNDKVIVADIGEMKLSENEKIELDKNLEELGYKT